MKIAIFGLGYVGCTAVGCITSQGHTVVGVDVSAAIRTEEGGRGASTVAAIPAVREALFVRQRDFMQPPGLVADGRDMGSVVFKDAVLKIFLTANVEIRADRRYKQPIGKNMPANYAKILQDLQERDTRDSQRRASPLVQTPDAVLLDTSYRSINDAVEFVLNAYKNILQNIA